MKNRIFSPLTPSGGIGKVMLVVMMVFVGLSTTLDVTAQRVRTTAVFDADTTTRPKAGFVGIGVRSGNAYLVPPTGNNVRLANYSLFTGLTTNYLLKWNGSKLVNSGVFESGGNVGIGTATPDRKLVINGEMGFGYTDGNSYSGLRQNIAGGHYGLQFFSAITSSPTNRSYDFLNNSGNSLVTILNGGFVGVGTASPSHKLTVAASSLYTSINSGDGLVVSSPSITSAEMILGVNGASGNIIQSRAGSIGWPLLLNPYDGNVGIGTTSPSAKLHVLGDAWIRQADASYLRMTSNTTTANINFNNTTGLSFAYNDGADLMRITAVGNVGIGTTSPSYKLDVNGTIHAGFVGANIRMRSDGTSSNDSFLGVDGSGIMYIANWDANRGFRISNTGNINVIGSGSLGVGTTSPTSKLQVVGLPTYADNAAATSGGLTAGAFYRTSTGVLMVVY